MKKLKSKRGFTLIELIVVIAVLGILAAILIPQYAKFVDHAKKSKALTDAHTVMNALYVYQTENGYIPAYGIEQELTPYIGGRFDGMLTVEDADSFTLTEGNYKVACDNGTFTAQAMN